MCCLVLGDGFTQGFLSAFGIRGDVRCTISDMFPAPDNLEYIPVNGDRFAKEPLWTEKKWPKLFAEHKSSGLSRRDFIIHLSKACKPINCDVRARRLSLETDSIEYELRCYLWHYFRGCHYKIRKGLENSEHSVRWDWGPLLMYIASEFKIAIVSYNYDTWFEDFMRAPFVKTFPPNDVASFVEKTGYYHPYHFRSGTILVTKPHGCIRHSFSPFQAYNNPNLWLEKVKFEQNIIIRSPTRVTDMVKFPQIPDLIPPGRQGDDLCNPNSISLAYSKMFIRDSSLIIICGLSASEPDTKEISELIACAKNDAQIFHVGLNDYKDYENPMAQISKHQVDENYHFFDAQDVGSIRKSLCGIFKPIWPW